MILECVPITIICSSALAAALVVFLFAFVVTYCKSNKLPRDAILTHSVTEFQNLLTADGDDALTVPFQLAKYGFLKLYTHHVLVTGWARNVNGDYLLTTVEYTAGGRWRGWGACGRMAVDAIRRIHRFYRHFWGRVKLQVLLLSEEVSATKPILLLRNDHDLCEQHAPCPNTISNMEEAKRVLWDRRRMEKLLRRHKKSDLELEELTENGQSTNDFENFKQRLEQNRRNDALFFTLAARLKPILNETNWSASFNSCEHLANYLLTGRHWSRQLEEAHFCKLLLLHIIGPILELSWSFRLFSCAPHILAIFCASLIHDHLLYAICIFLVYAVEFFPAAWTISGMIGLEAQGRTASCVRVVVEAFTRSTLNATSISVGCLTGHWIFSCLPSIWDEVLISSAFFLVSHFIIFPLLAALFDQLLHGGNIGRLVTAIRLVTMLLILALPILLLAPYFFEVFFLVCGTRKNSTVF